MRLLRRCAPRNDRRRILAMTKEREIVLTTTEKKNIAGNEKRKRLLAMTKEMHPHMIKRGNNYRNDRKKGNSPHLKINQNSRVKAGLLSIVS